MTGRSDSARSERPLGEMREALMGTDGTPILGDVIAVRGKEGCTDVTCTRMGGRCVQWHCPRCGKQTDAQGWHRCTAAPPEWGHGPASLGPVAP